MTAVQAPTPGPLRPEDLRIRPGRQHRERAVRLALTLAASASIAISAAIILSLVGEAYSFISTVDLGKLWTTQWNPRFGDFDLRTIIIGSLIVTGVAMVFAFPIGLGAAIYLSEYASPRVRKVLKPALEMLAGIPSVVLGYFALTWISPEILQNLDSSIPQANLLVAGLGVGILTIPLVATVSEDAMRSVPNALREASYGLGAKRMTTCVNVVVPAAVSGLVAAAILATSRALGETMVVTIAAGGSGGAQFGTDPLEPGLTMTAAMATLAQGTDQVRGATGADAVDPFQSLYFVGLVLFSITLALNVVAGRFVARTRQKY